MTSRLVKTVARALLGPYELYDMYAIDLPLAEPRLPDDRSLVVLTEQLLAASDEAALRERAWYLGADSHAFGCLWGGRLVGVCFLWVGQRYREQRGFWPLKSDEAELVDIFTVPVATGRGVATALIRHACAQMHARGFRRLWARIWHSNAPSRRAFGKAGWRRQARVIQGRVLGRWPLRLQWRARAAAVARPPTRGADACDGIRRP